MNTTNSLTLGRLAIAGLMVAGCPGDEIPPFGTDGSGSTSSTSSSPATTNTPVTITSPTEDSTTSIGSGSGSADTSGSGTESPADSSTGGEVPPFVFNETPFEGYAQIDRAGMPGTNMLLNITGDKDAYNMGTPDDDAQLVFSTNIRNSLEYLHLGAPMMQVNQNTGLDDDLVAVGFNPCDAMFGGSCGIQVSPIVRPDNLPLDLDEPVGFPNGRALGDPVMDVMLTYILVDLRDNMGRSLNDLDGDGILGPSLNPLYNDVEFDAEFPYLAAAHR